MGAIVQTKADPQGTVLLDVLDGAIARLGLRVGLSRRERAVLRQLALGSSYPEVGRALTISARTVKMHAAQLRAKTGAASRASLIGMLFRA